MSEQERWQLGGKAPEVYERHLVPAIFGSWAPLLIEQAALCPGQRVLDVRAGQALWPVWLRHKLGLQAK